MSSSGGVIQLQRGLDVEQRHHAREELAVVGQSLVWIRGQDESHAAERQASWVSHSQPYLRDLDLPVEHVLDGGV